MIVYNEKWLFFIIFYILLLKASTEIILSYYNRLSFLIDLKTSLNDKTKQNRKNSKTKMWEMWKLKINLMIQQLNSLAEITLLSNKSLFFNYCISKINNSIKELKGNEFEKKFNKGFIYSQLYKTIVLTIFYNGLTICLISS